MRNGTFEAEFIPPVRNPSSAVSFDRIPVLTAIRIILAGHEEELGAQQGRDVLPHGLALHQRRTGVRVIAHHAAAQAVVALAGETLAPQEARVARALVCHVLALGVDALDEEFERAHVVAGDQNARGLLEALPYQRERQRRRGLAKIRAAGLLLAVVRVEV